MGACSCGHLKNQEDKFLSKVRVKLSKKEIFFNKNLTKKGRCFHLFFGSYLWSSLNTKNWWDKSAKSWAVCFQFWLKRAIFQEIFYKTSSTELVRKKKIQIKTSFIQQPYYVGILVIRVTCLNLNWFWFLKIILPIKILKLWYTVLNIFCCLPSEPYKNLVWRDSSSHSWENLSLRIIKNHFTEPQNLKKSCWTTRVILLYFFNNLFKKSEIYFKCLIILILFFFNS